MNRSALTTYAAASRTANALLTAIEYLESAAEFVPMHEPWNPGSGFEAMNEVQLFKMRKCLMEAEQKIADVKAAIRVLRAGGL